MVEKYYQVSKISEALELLNLYPDNSKIVAGATDLWLEFKNGIHQSIDNFIDISRIKNLDEISEDVNGVVHIGPLATHAHCVRSEITKNYATCLYEACKSVGSPQIRNRGTIVGNVVTASPANDTIGALMALDATIVATSSSGSREIPITSFYKGVRKTVLQKNEIVTDIWFKKLDDFSFSFFIKQGLRKAQAISLINISVVCKFDSTQTIDDLRIAFGSLAPTVVRALKAEEFAKGKHLKDLDLENLAAIAITCISPISDIRTTASYRASMAKILLKRGLEASIKSVSKTKKVNQNEITLWGKNNKTFTPLEHQCESDRNSKIRFILNGDEKKVDFIPGQTLLDIIRAQKDTTGTKEGCGEGECGACTVFMDGIAVLACLIPAARAQDAVVETIEQLQQGDEISSIQKAFIEENAVQCGYCTPGFIMSATKLLEEISKPTSDEIKIAISGNLCRGTGYYKIFQAIQKAAETG